MVFARSCQLLQRYLRDLAARTTFGQSVGSIVRCEVLAALHARHNLVKHTQHAEILAGTEPLSVVVEQDLAR